MKYNNSSILVFFMAIFGVCNAQLACAGFVTNLNVATISEPNGGTLYLYTLTNDVNSSFNAVSFALSVASNSQLTNISGPDGWDVTYTPNSTLITWESSDTSTDARPGRSVVFGFESNLAPIIQAYVINSSDPGDFPAFNVGQLIGPGIASVPAPTSMIPLGIGMVTLAGYSVYRGKRQQ